MARKAIALTVKDMGVAVGLMAVTTLFWWQGHEMFLGCLSSLGIDNYQLC